MAANPRRAHGRWLAGRSTAGGHSDLWLRTMLRDEQVKRFPHKGIACEAIVLLVINALREKSTPPGPGGGRLPWQPPPGPLRWRRRSTWRSADARTRGIAPIPEELHGEASARFPSAEHLASYSGTTPRVHASGGKVRYGHVRSDSNHYLKWAFMEAANVIATNRRMHPGRHVSRLCERIRQRRGITRELSARWPVTSPRPPIGCSGRGEEYREPSCRPRKDKRALAHEPVPEGCRNQ